MTEAGLAAAGGDGEPDELFDAFLRLVRHLAPDGSAGVLV